MTSAVRKLVRYFLLLSLFRASVGNGISASRLRSVKRLSVFNILKRDRLRMRRLAHSFHRKVRRPRRFHVAPILQERPMYGAWRTLIPTMREFNRDEYFKFMRMTPESFDWLLEKVSPLITKRSLREAICPGERLAVTLRYLASGDSMASLSYLFRISDQVISNIVLETTAAIWYAIKDIVFEPLSQDFWKKKSAEFESMWQYPMCVGAVDGKHCFVQKFPMRGSEHYNYKFGNSVILLAVSDAKYKFIIVDVGARGRESDGGVFERSEFGKLFLNHELGLPPPAYCEPVMNTLPHVFVGDDAFPLGPHMLKPFDQSNGDRPEETVFNYRLSRARRVVENAFGILAARFRIFRKNIIGSETLVQNIILACTALHNMHLIREDSIPPKQRMYMPDGYADVYRSNGKLKRGRWRKECKHLEKSIFQRLCHQEAPDAIEDNGFSVREKFVEYFVTCPLPWQYEVLPDL